MKLFDRLKLSRTFSGLSQAQLAYKLAVHPSVITRYEGSREPGKWVLVKISAETGVPSLWINTGTDFNGIVTGRIELPGREYSVKTLRSIEGHLANIFPEFLSENPPNRMFQLKTMAVNLTPSVFILDNDNYCLVLFTDKTTSMLLSLMNNYSSIHNVPIITREIPLDMYLNAYMQPQFIYLKNILVAAHAEDNKWSESDNLILSDASIILSVDPWRMYIFKFNAPENLLLNYEEIWIEFISNYLISVGCTDVEGIISKETEEDISIPEYAPENWSFNALGINFNKGSYVIPTYTGGTSNIIPAIRGGK